MTTTSSSFTKSSDTVLILYTGQPLPLYFQNPVTLLNLVFNSFNQKKKKKKKDEEGEMGDSTMTCADILLAIILPPFSVFRKFGCKVEFWICVLLTLLGWLPGVIYAFWALNSSPSDLPFLWWIYKGPVST